MYDEDRYMLSVSKGSSVVYETQLKRYRGVCGVNIEVTV